MFMISLDVNSMGGLLTELSTIITQCWSIISGNWLLMGTLIVAVGIPTLSAVISLIRSRG